MLKFKTGDLLVSTDREEDIVKVVKTNENNDTSTYGIVALEGSCVGDSWYDGKYMWSQGTIETCYKHKKIDLKFTIGDKIRLKGTHDALDEITGVDATNDAFTYELATNPNYYWTRVSIEDYYELAPEQEQKQDNEFEKLRKKYATLSQKREDIHEELLSLNADLDNLNYDIIQVENEWKKMLY